jgi:RecJ-like exonuclease
VRTFGGFNSAEYNVGMTEMRTCLYCGDLLTGRQQKYCKDAHRKAHVRQLARERQADTEDNPDAQKQAPRGLVPIEQYSTVVAANQRLQGEKDMLEADTTRLRSQVDTLDQRIQALTTDVNTLTSESAESRGALQAERRFNRVLLIAAAVALGLLVLLTVLIAAGVV